MVAIATKRPPSPPDIKGRWRDMRNELLDSLGSDRHTAELVDQMLLNLAAANHTLTEAVREPLVDGSRGQVSEHPGFRIASRCQERALATARALGMFEGGSDADEKQDPFTEVRDELAALREKRIA